MSVTATVTSQAVAEWVRIFPRQATETYTSSVTFMKQLTVIAVSTITYLKNVFPEESYTVENFGGVKLRILKKRCRDELSQFISTALTQAFEAFEKKYLHQLALCFYEGECEADNLLEYHVFEYSYKEEAASVALRSRAGGAGCERRYSLDGLRDRTLHLIKACVVMQSCQAALPAAYDISLRLYYNDSAPAGYQAPGFSCGAARALAGAVRVGAVSTRHHRLLASSFVRDALPSSHDVNPSSNPPVMTQNEDDFDEVRSETEGSGSGTVRAMSDQIQCSCNKTDVDENTLLLTCQYCSRQQHASCYGMRYSPLRHCCVRCSDAAPDLVPTDAKLATLTDKKRECLCIFRRALWLCEREGAVSTLALAKNFSLTQLNAVKLMKLLYSQGIILTDDEHDLVSPRKIIPEQLKMVMGKFFQDSESEMVDNLLSETLSQRADISDPDPVGDVLAPMEKISLHNATTLGTIVEPMSLRESAHNVTLQEYKNTILNNHQIEEELPLSGSQNSKGKENIGTRSGKRKLEEPPEKQLRSGVKTKRVKKNK